jgi:hypothetical protein
MGVNKMPGGRANPASAPALRKTLDQSVVNPQANQGSVGKGLGSKGMLPKKPVKGKAK